MSPGLTASAVADPLPSWRGGAAKKSVLDFVDSVTTPGIDDGPGKPVHIWARVGRLPLLAAGNADGDIAMLESSRLSVLVHHDDGEREFAYDGGAERALAAAAERGWTVISMRDDFAEIF
jgi:hypothetical protein